MQYLLRLFFVFIIVLSTLLSNVAISQSSAESTKLNASAFSRLPAFVKPELSNSGKKIAFVQNMIEPEELSILVVADLEKGGSKMLLSSDNEKIKINWFEWANDDILLISAAYESKNGRSRYYQTRLFSMDVNEKEPKAKLLVKPRERVGVGVVIGKHISQFQDRVLDFIPHDPEHIIMALDYDSPNTPSVYRVNVRTGRAMRIERSKLSIRNWILDRQQNVRIGISYNYDSGESRIYYRKKKEDKFEKLFEYEAFNEPSISIMGFDADPNIMYYKAYKDDTLALYSMDMTTRESTLLLHHDNYDVSGGLIYSKKLNDVVGVYDAHSDYGRHYFDDYLIPFHQALDKVFPDTLNTILTFDSTENKYVLRRHSDALATDYFVGDRSKGTLDFLFAAYPEIDATPLSEHEKVTYTARDGLEIEGYLSLPLEGEAPFPMVMHPHGGPGARDYDGFDPWVSFMTNQGYAVFRPNFRGSEGYGYEFAQAQMQGWGLQMQDDITDAANWLISEGIANKDKFCIFGASYGGYAAAMAAVKTPKLFTCAASFAGVFDLRALARQQRAFLGGDLVSENQLGDNSKDLDARSPITGVSKIQSPILLMHGSDDISVNVWQSRNFADELEDQNKTFKFIELEYGDHYLSIQRNRTRFFKELEDFLHEHLGD